MTIFKTQAVSFGNLAKKPVILPEFSRKYLLKRKFSGKNRYLSGILIMIIFKGKQLVLNLQHCPNLTDFVFFFLNIVNSQLFFLKILQISDC